MKIQFNQVLSSLCGALMITQMVCVGQSTGTVGSGNMTNNCSPTAGNGGLPNSTSIGCGAGNGTMTGDQNTFVGKSCGALAGAGTNNSAFGWQAFYTNSGGSFNWS